MSDVAGHVAAPRACHGTSGAVIADPLRVADTHWTRLRGLLGTSGLAPGEGLWITPCRQVHMFGMRYAIDVVFLDDAGRVVQGVAELAPWKVSPSVREAATALELPAGSIARLGLTAGTPVVIERAATAGPAALPAWAAAAGNVALAAFSLQLAFLYFSAWRFTGQPVALLTVVLHVLIAGLFVARRRPLAVSARPQDWLLGAVGMVWSLMFRSAGVASVLAVPGRVLQLAGIVLAIAAVASLGRSFGVVAANRGLRTGSVYGAVRHPLYAAEALRYLGVLLVQPTTRNVIVVLVAYAVLGGRALVEERLLAGDPSYRAYRDRVRWRFVPFVL